MSDKTKSQKAQEKPVNGEEVPIGYEHTDEATGIGAISIHHGVLAIIARMATLKVPGVADMSGSLADGIASFIGKDVPDRGIRVAVDGQNVSVDLYIILDYGVRIPQVAYQVQNDVKKTMEEMTGKKVVQVNVVVQGVRMVEKEKKEKKEGTET